VPGMHQPPNDIAAHPAKADHSELHLNLPIAFRWAPPTQPSPDFGGGSY
jgi:hypothetical protein